MEKGFKVNYLWRKDRNWLNGTTTHRLKAFSTGNRLNTHHSIGVGVHFYFGTNDKVLLGLDPLRLAFDLEKVVKVRHHSAQQADYLSN